MDVSTTALKLQYAERTWDYNFSEELELALEEDYVVNPDIYTDETFELIRAMLVLAPDYDPKLILKVAHRS